MSQVNDVLRSVFDRIISRLKTLSRSGQLKLRLPPLSSDLGDCSNCAAGENLGYLQGGIAPKAGKFCYLGVPKWRFVRGKRSEKGPKSSILPPRDQPPPLFWTRFGRKGGVDQLYLYWCMYLSKVQILIWTFSVNKCLKMFFSDSKNNFECFPYKKFFKMNF